MNDSELDELMNLWVAPTVPTGLRARVRAEFAAGVQRKPRLNVFERWQGLLAAGLVGVAGILAVSAFADPQTVTAVSGSFRIPFTVDSVFFHYRKDGTPQIAMYTKSFQHNLRELTLSSSRPGKPFVNAIRRLADFTGFIFFDATLPLRADAERSEEAAAKASTKARCTDGRPVVGTETILGYETTIIRFGGMTMWRAPDLGCFLMKFSMEEMEKDGTFHLVRSRQALKVTINH